MFDIFEETKALLLELEASHVEYALCGALALAVHGISRNTSDIDVLVITSSVEAAIEVTKRRGFIFGAAPMGFNDGVQLHRWSKIVGSETLTVDLLVASPAYQQVWDTRIRKHVGTDMFSVVSRDGLIQMKLAAARPKDLADVQSLLEIDR